MVPSRVPYAALLATAVILHSSFWEPISALTTSSHSSFFGTARNAHCTRHRSNHDRTYLNGASSLTMRKQKASNRRTRRLQKGDLSADDLPSSLKSNVGVTNFPRQPLTRSPMATATWQHKTIETTIPRSPPNRNSFPNREGEGGGGRGRSRKRLETYASLLSYHKEFVDMLTMEYRAEEAEVLGRLEASTDDPIKLEIAGHALFDLFPERRGNLFSEEVYRFTKAIDSTTNFPARLSKSQTKDDMNFKVNNGRIVSYDTFLLPSNHKFSSNDVIMLTLQPAGSGDYFGTSSLPTHPGAISVEGRVLNTGPHYIDVAVSAGAFEATFGPAPNNISSSGKGDPGMRIRADRFVSNIPYTRMIAALGQLTSLQEKNKKQKSPGDEKNKASGKKKQNQLAQSLKLDPVLRESIISTYCYADELNPLYLDACDLNELSRKISKPPMPNSAYLTGQVLSYMRSNPQNVFQKFNEPQITAIGSALTRRLTLIQGPPGTGKTTVASAIGFGFVHQCRNISPQAKVLACAFSNTGADNLTENLLKLGLKVVRVGKASSVSEWLWDYTLDAYIANDFNAKEAQEEAVRATYGLKKNNKRGKDGKRGNRSKSDAINQRNKREYATEAVKASVQACRVAATKALREADVIVSTSVGAADPYLLAACGIVTDDDIEEDNKSKVSKGEKQANAPDDKPALSLPFVIVDEACQSIEPGNLIPITATDSCRSLVLLGDPCQLPPTVRSDTSGKGTSSPLSVSLMARLASTLPHPVIVSAKADKTEMNEYYLNSKSTRQACSLVHYKNSRVHPHVSYRKRFSGSLLLSVQYRMHPSISAFSSAVFYDGLLSTPAFLSEMRSLPESLNNCLPADDPTIAVRFINVRGRNNERLGKPESSASLPSFGLKEDTSYSNKAEAGHIMEFLKTYLQNCVDTKSCLGSIGVVTPYASQVSLLKSLIAADAGLKTLAQKLSTKIEVKSVDAYQGREREIIIFSAVRSNRYGKLGFLTDWRRMNVAITRAKSGLVVFGDMETLQSGDTHWEAFGDWCKGLGCVKDVDE